VASVAPWAALSDVASAVVSDVLSLSDVPSAAPWGGRSGGLSGERSDARSGSPSDAASPVTSRREPPSVRPSARR
jgi:hypothetical protein